MFLVGFLILGRIIRNSFKEFLNFFYKRYFYICKLRLFFYKGLRLRKFFGFSNISNDKNNEENSISSFLLLCVYFLGNIFLLSIKIYDFI